MFGPLMPHILDIVNSKLIDKYFGLIEEFSVIFVYVPMGSKKNHIVVLLVIDLMEDCALRWL